MGGRDYEALVRRFQQLPGVETRVLGQAGDYPVFCLEKGAHPGRPTALLIGGTHGDEPAGPEAVLEFLGQEREAWLAAFNFAAIPCLNPHGYAHHTRHNAQDVDINWAYKREDVPEIQLIRQWVAGRRFEFAVDFHEDWESPGFYLYELRRDRPLIGPLVAARVERICPLNTSPHIEGHPAQDGLILPNPQREEQLRGEGIPIVLYHYHTDHLLTTETPTSLPLETRVQAHLAVLEVMVEAHLS